MRVLHVITGLELGGAERMLTRIAKTDFGPDVTQGVVSLMDDGAFGQELRAHGVPLFCLGLNRSQVTPSAVFRLAGIIRRRRPDLIMTWLYHADLVGSLAAMLAATGMRRVIWNIRCSSMEFEHYSWKTRAVARILRRLSSQPAAIVCNSQAGLEAHRAFGYRPRRWVLLPNGFELDVWRPDDTDRVAVRSELGVAANEVAVAHVARVDPMKGQGLFLEAAAIVAERGHAIHAVLVGRGTEFLTVPDSVRARVTLLGSRTDLPRLLRGFDMVVMCSSFGEGFPNSVGEAMASGVPCAVTDVGDAAALVGETGFVVPLRDPNALADAIEAFIALPVETRAELGRKARKRIEQEFSMPAVRERFLSLWREVILPR